MAGVAAPTTVTNMISTKTIGVETAIFTRRRLDVGDRKAGPETLFTVVTIPRQVIVAREGLAVEPDTRITATPIRNFAGVVVLWSP